MLRVKTKIRPSDTHGTGLFSDEFIPQGTVTWQRDAELDIAIPKEVLNAEPQIIRDFLLYYCYLDQTLDKYILCGDNQRYINHIQDKNKENILSTPNQDVAARDIQPGEEFLCDYNKFDNTYFERMGIQPHQLH